MFIGKYDQSVSYEFARMPGRSDSKPRPKRSLLKNAAKVAGAAGGVGVLALGAKNAPGAIKRGMAVGGRKGVGKGFQAGTKTFQNKVGSDVRAGVSKVSGAAKTVSNAPKAARNSFVKARSSFNNRKPRKAGAQKMLSPGM